MQTIVQTIDSGSFQGTTFRCTDEFPRRVSLIDFISSRCHKSTDAARQQIKDYVNKYPEIRDKVTYVQFAGERQHATPVTDAVGVLLFLSKMRGKWHEEFRSEQANLLARYLGGDISINQEVSAIRQAQESAPHDAPMRVFGEAVESGQIGNLNQLEVVVDRSKVDWHDKRLDTRESNKAKAAVIKECINKPTRLDYIESNMQIAVAVTGQTPKEFRDNHGIKSKNTRDFYTPLQLDAVKLLEGLEAKTLRSSGNRQEFKKRFDNILGQMKNMTHVAGLHDDALVAGPPKLNEAESEELHKVRENKRKSIEPPPKPAKPPKRARAIKEKKPQQPQQPAVAVQEPLAVAPVQPKIIKKTTINQYFFSATQPTSNNNIM